MLILISTEIGLQKNITVTAGLSRAAGHCIYLGTSSITMTYLDFKVRKKNVLVPEINLPFSVNAVFFGCMLVCA